MSALILERHTPRQWRLEPAESVQVTDRGYTFMPLKRNDPLADRTREVMDALFYAARTLPVGPNLLERAYKAASDGNAVTFPLMHGTKFSAKQANGRPAMVVVNG